MNKVLSNQTNWSPPTSHAQLKRHEDFTEKLHTKPQKEPGPARPDLFVAMKGSVALVSSATTVPTKDAELLPSAKFAVSELGQSTVPTAAGPSMLESDSADVDGDFWPMLKATLIRECVATPAVGVLSGMLTWSRVYPEHLIASGYLSVVDMATSDGNVPSEQAAWVASGVDVHESTPNAATLVFDLGLDVGKAVAASWFDASSQPIAYTGGTTAPGLDSEVVSASRELDASVLADHFWAERLMRLTHGSDGRSTVWLRDYGLKENDLESVTAKLRQRGQKEGVLIDRVVINGHEIWCAAASEGER